MYLSFFANNSILFNYIAPITTHGCGDFYQGSNQGSNKYCFTSNTNWQDYCIGNTGQYNTKVECTDTTAEPETEQYPVRALNFVFDEEKWMPMVFNEQNERKCQIYHLDHLEKLAWALGYSNYTVNVKKTSNGCKFVGLDDCGDMRTIFESGPEASSAEAPYDVTFWGYLDGKYIFVIRIATEDSFKKSMQYLQPNLYFFH